MDLITNYYEKLVLDRITQQLAGTAEARDEDYIADIACVALNKLPARYVRHIVDTRFFESEEDFRRTDLQVDRAVTYAVAYISQRAGISPDGTTHARPDIDSSQNA